MLVVKLRRNESVFCTPSNISFNFFKIEGHQAVIGIDAPHKEIISRDKLLLRNDNMEITYGLGKLLCPHCLTVNACSQKIIDTDVQLHIDCKLCKKPFISTMEIMYTSQKKEDRHNEIIS